MFLLVLVSFCACQLLVYAAYCPVLENPAKPSSVYCNNELRRYPLKINTEDVDCSATYPLYEQTWSSDINEFVIGVFGMQEIVSDSISADILRNRFIDVIEDSLTTGINIPSHFDHSTFVDSENIANQLYIAYWIDRVSFAIWINSSPFMQWLHPSSTNSSSDPLLFKNENGYYMEIMFVPIENLETVHTRPPIGHQYSQLCKGCSNLANKNGYYDSRLHAYFGSMHDRIPGSDYNTFPGEVEKRYNDKKRENSRGQRIIIDIPHNMNVIRSGQDLSLATNEEQYVYKTEMEPVLLEGMDYLRDHPRETNCIQLRFIYDVNGEEEHESTAGFGYFLSLSDLEKWSKSHATHLNIFNKFNELATAGKLDNVYLWHEVYVVDYGYAEYINCHNGTSLISWES